MEYRTFSTMILLFGTVCFVSMVVGSWPVCYHRRSCDGRNVNVKRINCEANQNQIYKKYTSEASFSMMDLLSGLRSSAITCNFGILPHEPHAIANSSICLNNCEGDECPLTCEENYYVVGDKHAVCKNNNSLGQWVVEYGFVCEPIICPFSKLPVVYGGQFNETDCYGNEVSYVCNMSCDTNFYTTEVKQTICQKVGYKTGNWSSGNFSCIEILCSNHTLPTPINGTVDSSKCSEISVGDKCNITCALNFFPTYPGYVTCKNNGPPNGVWSNNSFSCFEIVCSYDTLPDPINGFVNYTADCSGTSVGDICNITCNINFYPTNPGYVTCENNGSHVGIWSDNSFSCFEIVCSSPPNAINGSLTSSDCSEASVGDKCNISCWSGFHPNGPGYVTCENHGSSSGVWSSDSLSCFEILCLDDPLSSFPGNNMNISSCTGYSVGDNCNVQWYDEEAPTVMGFVTCEDKGGGIGQWSNITYSELPNAVGTTTTTSTTLGGTSSG